MEEYNIIPLGDHCAISILLEELNLRTKSYPFDWVSFLDQNMVLKAIVNDFDGYTSECNLEKIIKSDMIKIFQNVR